MKGDFSRDTFQPTQGYSGVRMQQGRVQLDADWNEQLDIATHLRETAVADIVGPLGVPLGLDETTNDSFRVTVAGGVPSLGPGRAYVHGALLTHEGDAPVALTDQPYLPGFALPAANPAGATSYIAYLDVWRRAVSALEDPAIRETALGGPDTAVRDETVWQVRLQEIPVGTAVECESFTPTRPDPLPRLAARSTAPPTENQLYRIEVHDGGALGEATFKWSRDNASVVALAEEVSSSEIRLGARIRQDLGGVLEVGDWVEVTDRGRLLRGEPGYFARLSSVSDDARLLTVEGWPEVSPPGSPPDLATDQPLLVRLWSSPNGPEAITVDAMTNGGYLPLSDGVEVRFDDAAAIRYRTGDYWLVPSRAAAAGVEWPVDELETPLFLEPRGIRRREAPLAVLTLSSAGAWTVVEDCRALFRATTRVPGDEKVSVSGDDMTGDLNIDADLEVRGRVTVGPSTSAGVPGELVMDASPIRPARGDGSSAGVQFYGDPGDPGGPAGQGYLRLDPTTRTLLLGVGDLNTERIALRQRLEERLVVASEGYVGIGTSAPDRGLHVAVDRVLLDAGSEVRLDGPLVVLPGSGGPQQGYVLTALDSQGKAAWRQLPDNQRGGPVFLDNAITVGAGVGGVGWTVVTLDDRVPGDVSAVIVEAQAVMNGPDGGATIADIYLRKGPDRQALSLLRGRAAGGGDAVAWGGQGTYPVTNGDRASFQFTVTGPGFNGGWSIRAVGYFT